MTKNPLYNALSATGYISLIVFIMTVVPKSFEHTNTFLAPLAFISVFTLSAAVMGYIFCYQPLLLYFDGKKKQATNLFLQTILIFAIITALIFVVALFGRFS